MCGYNEDTFALIPNFTRKLGYELLQEVISIFAASLSVVYSNTTLCQWVGANH